MSEPTTTQPEPRSFFVRVWRRKWLRFTLIAFLVLVPTGAVAAIEGFHYVHTSTEFCIGCHLMKVPGEKWSTGPHKGVICQTCHEADIFQEARLGYASYIQRLEHIGEHAKVPTRICMSCHVQPGTKWKQIGDTPGHRLHVAEKGFDCLQCHVTKLHAFKADLSQCVRCHADKTASAEYIGKQVELGPLETAHCLECHDYLGKRSDTLVPTAATCRNCHTPLAEAPAQVLPAFRGENGEGRQIWVAKGHDDCVGCHKPHGKPLEDPTSCLACHQSILVAPNRHVTDERVGKCGTCHDPHAKTKSR
jgi:hypothetical protein